jgi:hypothetical protein
MDHKTFPAPVRGWVTNENLAAAGVASALVLENGFPTSKGVEIRGGKDKYATLADADPVYSIWTFKTATAEKFFGADETNIFDISTIADEDAIPTAAVTGQTSGYYNTVQIGTAGGDYQYVLNGDDKALIYDGASLTTVDDATHTLDYDAETGAFTAGLTLTGGTSSATAEIVEVIDNGTTGTLRIKGITGTFQDNETITDSSTGSADADGTQTAVTATLTGADTSNLIFGWLFKSRLFFIEKDTMRAWYLGTDAIGGALNSISLAGIFQKGGKLLFGGRWSLDSGSGLDDKCVFVSDQGEVAVYEGTNPASASTWSQIGVYQITEPLGPRATMQAGGDLLIATRQGLVPLSEAIRKDIAALSLAAISRPIEPDWKAEAADRSTVNWEIIKWPSKNRMIVSQPQVSADQTEQCLVANLETGAWCKFTGWDVRCLALYQDFAYFGTNDGYVYKMEVGGNDDGDPYTMTIVGQFDHFKSPGVSKTVQQARAIWLSTTSIGAKVSASTDYNIVLPTAPNSIADYTVDQWDVGKWDEAQWDSASENVQALPTKWESVGKTGFAFAPQFQVTVGITPKPRIELVAIDMTYTPGAVVV